MGSRWLVLSVVVTVAAGCSRGGQSGDEGAMAGASGGPDASDGGRMSMMPPGVTCASDTECGAYARSLADELERGRPRRALALNQAHCLRDCAEPTACACLYTIAGLDFLERVDVVVLGGSTDCDLHGAAPYCLLSAADFAGCEPGAADSCEDACLDALARLEADQAGYRVDVRAAECNQGECRWVWRLNDRCFAGSADSRASPEFSCDLSDQAILSSAFPEVDPVSPDAATRADAGADSQTAGPRDAGTGSAAPGTTSRSGVGPEEPNWRTMVEGGRTWATAEVCGHELDPVCVSGDCSGAAADGGGVP